MYIFLCWVPSPLQNRKALGVTVITKLWCVEGYLPTLGCGAGNHCLHKRHPTDTGNTDSAFDQAGPRALCVLFLVPGNQSLANLSQAALPVWLTQPCHSPPAGLGYALSQSVSVSDFGHSSALFSAPHPTPSPSLTLPRTALAGTSLPVPGGIQHCPLSLCASKNSCGSQQPRIQVSKAIVETGPGVGRFWELLGRGDPGLPCSRVLAALGPGLKLKHSPGSLTTSQLSF